MVFYTGDIHGMPWNIVKFSKKYHLTEDDVIVILGDVGANYYCDDRDRECKAALNKVKPTILCIHGNHEARPSTLAQYQLKEWKGGLVWYEKDYPNLLFAKDGEIFELEGLKHLVIGGAYSVDKFYRLAHGANWFPDEQPSKEIKVYVEKQIREKPFDIVLSHTCPYKYEPTEVFLPMIDQDSVDASTEHWLDRIEEQIRYIAWFCGHWHIDKRIDRMHFLFHSFESNEQFNREEGAQRVPITVFTRKPTWMGNGTASARISRMIRARPKPTPFSGLSLRSGM